MEWIYEEINQIKIENLYRKRHQVEGLIDFCSNDYLALRKHPQVVEASIKVLRDYGLGSGASPLVSGYTAYHRKLEERLAYFKGTSCCVIFGSGYLANVGSIPALVGEGDLILSDELNHASIIDACRLSKARTMVFRHREYQHLEELLHSFRKDYRRCLIVTDSVFSMDGDVADIRKLKELARAFECMLYLDEAHATGVLGENGRGGLEEAGEEWEEYILLMGTLSKALGAYGAFVCGSEAMCEYLVNRARSLIFSTSLPPAVCAGVLEAIEIIEKENWRVKKLKELSSRLYEELKALGFEVYYHSTPIIPIMLYSESTAVRLRDALLSEGIFLQAIRYPTVPRGKARLRLTASLNYSEENIALLLNALRKYRAIL